MKAGVMSVEVERRRLKGKEFSQRHWTDTLYTILAALYVTFFLLLSYAKLVPLPLMVRVTQGFVEEIKGGYVNRTELARQRPQTKELYNSHV
jgi:hypothetical protein